MPMTKSRTARVPFLALALAWPSAALADPPVTAEETVRAYDQWFAETAGAGRRPAAGRMTRCRQGADPEEIVVCGRGEDDSYRIPYVPEEGARTRLVAGEAPSGAAALSVGDACCGDGGGINLIALGGAIARGVDRILHPD